MTRGRLRIYLGAAPGVGKTVAMLAEGRRRKARGTDVVIALLETHGRSFTADQAEGLEVVPRRTVELRGTTLTELDVDAVIARKPQMALVDELAHTNAPGSLRAKRCEDIDILLDAGIDVISTVNIQHLESLNDVVEAITGVVQRETVPDDVVRSADQIELVDMSPESASAEHPWRRHRDPAHADGMAASGRVGATDWASRHAYRAASRSLRTRLRARAELPPPRYIITEPGIGYRFLGEGA